MAESKTGRIESAEPKLTNEGSQREYKDARGNMNYVYMLKMDNGDEAEVSGRKKDVYTYKIGSLINYQIQEGQYGPKVTGVGLVKSKSEGQSSYNDPTNNLRIAMSMALAFAVRTYEYIAKDKLEKFDDIKSIAIFYYKWITVDETVLDRDSLTRRWYAVEKGIECMKFEAFEKSSKAIIELANEFHKLETSIIAPVKEEKKEEPSV